MSTDKAVYPINAMGISKAMMEKVIIAKSRNLERTIQLYVVPGMVMLWPLEVPWFHYL
nr:polysaccharide biosynthesis protein [Providencia rustigianii]